MYAVKNGAGDGLGTRLREHHNKHNVHNMTSTSDSIFYVIFLNAQMFYKTIQLILFEEILPP